MSPLYSRSTAERCMCHREGRQGCPLHMEIGKPRKGRDDHAWRTLGSLDKVTSRRRGSQDR